VAIVNYSVRSARQIDAVDVSSRDAGEGATLPSQDVGWLQLKT
jgi:hypothetical protein